MTLLDSPSSQTIPPSPLAGDLRSRRFEPLTETDDVILRRYVETRSGEAFAQLVYRHAGWVYSTCHRSLRDSHLAEDATQAVFLLLSRKAPVIKRGIHLGGWLFQTCRYVLADLRKNRARYQRRQEMAREAAQRRLTHLGAPEPLADPALSAALDEALASLRESDRQVILMHFYEGLSVCQIAEQLGLAKEAAKKRLTRALSRLRAQLVGKSNISLPRTGAVLSLAALSVLVRVGAAKAAPAGLASILVKAATVPGLSSILAETIAAGVRQATIHATAKLLTALAVTATPVAVFVAVNPPTTGHRAGTPTTAPAHVSNSTETDSNFAVPGPSRVAGAPSSGFAPFRRAFPLITHPSRFIFSWGTFPASPPPAFASATPSPSSTWANPAIVSFGPVSSDHAPRASGPRPFATAAAAATPAASSPKSSDSRAAASARNHRPDGDGDADDSRSPGARDDDSPQRSPAAVARNGDGPFKALPGTRGGDLPPSLFSVGHGNSPSTKAPGGPVVAKAPAGNPPVVVKPPAIKPAADKPPEIVVARQASSRHPDDPEEADPGSPSADGREWQNPHWSLPADHANDIPHGPAFNSQDNWKLADLLHTRIPQGDPRQGSGGFEPGDDHPQHPPGHVSVASALGVQPPQVSKFIIHKPAESGVEQIASSPKSLIPHGAPHRRPLASSRAPDSPSAEAGVPESEASPGQDAEDPINDLPTLPHPPAVRAAIGSALAFAAPPGINASRSAVPEEASDEPLTLIHPLASRDETASAFIASVDFGDSPSGFDALGGSSEFPLIDNFPSHIFASRTASPFDPPIVVPAPHITPEPTGALFLLLPLTLIRRQRTSRRA